MKLQNGYNLIYAKVDDKGVRHLYASKNGKVNKDDPIIEVEDSKYGLVYEASKALYGAKVPELKPDADDWTKFMWLVALNNVIPSDSDVKIEIKANGEVVLG